MTRRHPKSASRLSVAALALATAAVGARLLLGCGSSAQSSSVFGTPAQGEPDASPGTFTPAPIGDGSTTPAPTSTTVALPPAGPPATAPECDPTVTRESCQPPESSFALPATIRVLSDGDAGCRQSLHAETRDGGAYACIVGTTTSCFGPLTVGEKFPFNLGHSTTGGSNVTATFTVRFEGDGGVPASVAVGGCYP